MASNKPFSVSIRCMPHLQANIERLVGKATKVVHPNPKQVGRSQPKVRMIWSFATYDEAEDHAITLADLELTSSRITKRSE